MYHVELRQFPHNFCRFNLTERQLRETILAAWVRGEWIEQGERKWSPHQATLTVVEGPELPVDQLSLGRGWRNAQRHGNDVTERVVAAERALAAGPPGSEPAPSSAADQNRPHPAAGRLAPVDGEPASPGEGPALEQLAKSLIDLLGEDSASLMGAWQIALERHPDRTPSECLALAEELVRR